MKKDHSLQCCCLDYPILNPFINNYHLLSNYIIFLYLSHLICREC